MSINRRTFLKGTLASGVIGVAIGAGLLTPQSVLAAWPKEAFQAKTVSDAIKSLTGSDSIAESADITVKAPDIAENGAVVDIKVSTTLKAESISIIAEKNPVPLVVSYNMGDTAEGYIQTRIKMGETSDVIAVVKSGGKLYSGKKAVKVTAGGCAS